MKVSEFLALLRCGFALAAAMINLDRDALDRVEVKVNRIHAQIDARKRGQGTLEDW